MLKFLLKHCCNSRCGVNNGRLTARSLQANSSKEAHHGSIRPPPRRAINPPEPMNSVPLDQLWPQLPQIQRQELLGQLTRILTQHLAPCDGKEVADE